MGVGAGLSMYVVVVQKFTFAISSPTFRQSHGTLGVLNEWPELPVDGRRRARSREKHTRVQLRHTLHSSPCPNLYIQCTSYAIGRHPRGITGFIPPKLLCIVPQRQDSKC